MHWIQPAWSPWAGGLHGPPINTQTLTHNGTQRHTSDTDTEVSAHRRTHTDKPPGTHKGTHPLQNSQCNTNTRRLAHPRCSHGALLVPAHTDTHIPAGLLAHTDTRIPASPACPRGPGTSGLTQAHFVHEGLATPKSGLPQPPRLPSSSAPCHFLALHSLSMTPGPLSPDEKLKAACMQFSSADICLESFLHQTLWLWR